MILIKKEQKAANKKEQKIEKLKNTIQKDIHNIESFAEHLEIDSVVFDKNE